MIKINDYQKNRFVASMFNTVANKKIAVLGFAFKKDTGDTRETPAIDVCKGLLGDKAQVSIYDPQVMEDQIQPDLVMNKSRSGGTHHPPLRLRNRKECTPSVCVFAVIRNKFDFEHRSPEVRGSGGVKMRTRFTATITMKMTWIRWGSSQTDSAWRV